MYEWTKGLGQQHFARDGESETMCGQAMLGSNHSKRIANKDKTVCDKCLNAMNEIEKKAYYKFFDILGAFVFNGS